MNRKCVITKGGFCLLDILPKQSLINIKKNSATKVDAKNCGNYTFSSKLNSFGEFILLYWLIYALFYLLGYLFLVSLSGEVVDNVHNIFNNLSQSIKISINKSSVKKNLSLVKYCCLIYCNVNQYKCVLTYFPMHIADEFFG